jgi:hypothetical protein
MKKTLFVVALVTLASVALFAQNSQIYGVPAHVVSKVGNLGHTTAYNEPAAVNKIFSNFGSATDKFDWTNGWFIAGPNSPLGEEQYIGYSFTPTKTKMATQIRVPLFFYSGFGTGSNDFNVGIWSDSNGIPGAKIVGAEKKNTPTWSGQQTDCCKTQTANIKATKLKGGTPYWVVLTNANAALDAIGVWDFVWDDATGNQAYNLGSGWNVEVVQVSAFAVYAGTK